MPKQWTWNNLWPANQRLMSMSHAEYVAYVLLVELVGLLENVNFKIFENNWTNGESSKYRKSKRTQFQRDEQSLTKIWPKIVRRIILIDTPRKIPYVTTNMTLSPSTMTGTSL